MVTMPTEAASDPALVREMLVAGMDCMRINCAHDAEPEWRAMLDNLRLAEDQTRRMARVVVDLPGPKLRTGPLASQPTSDRKGDYLRLGIGDRLLLTRDPPAAVSGSGECPTAQIGCSLAEGFAVTRRGPNAWLDEGTLGVGEQIGVRGHAARTSRMAIRRQARRLRGVSRSGLDLAAHHRGWSERVQA